MLAEQRIDIERGANIGGWIDGANLDMRAIGGREHLLEILGIDWINSRAGYGIARNATAKLEEAIGVLGRHAFTEKIDIGNDQVAIGFRQPHRAYHGDQPVIANAHLDMAADIARHRKRGIGIALEHAEDRPVERDLGSAAGNLEDASNLNGGILRAGFERTDECLPSGHVVHRLPCLSRGMKQR